MQREVKNVYNPLVVNVQGRNQQGRPKRSYRWQGNIKTDFFFVDGVYF